MKKLAGILLCAILVTLAFPLAASADMGPKPSVVVDFKDLEGERFYVTMLAQEMQYGPHSVPDAAAIRDAQEGKTPEEYAAYLKLAQYEDADGYHFWQVYSDCSEAKRFVWGYYPPERFKLLLYFPEADRLLAGPVSERYAFDSYFTATVTGADAPAAIRMETSYDYRSEAIFFAARVVLTLLAELGIALLFGLREKKLFGFIVCINMLTQLALNLALSVANYRGGPQAFGGFYVLLELGILLAEGLLYTACARRHAQIKATPKRLWLYAAAANLFSFVLGLRLADWIPAIF